MRHGSTSGAFNVFSTSGGAPSGHARPPCGLPAMARGRADHARMLAHAAKRRLTAQNLDEDGDYWKSCAPAALRKAIAIRCDGGLAKLP